MRRSTLSFSRDGLLSLIVVALALTNLSVTKIGDFQLVVFWPVLLLMIATNTKSQGRAQLPRSSVAFLLAVLFMIISWIINYDSIKITTIALTIGWIVYWYWLTVFWGRRLSRNIERTQYSISYIFFFTLLVSIFLTFLGWSESPFPKLFGWVQDMRSDQTRFYGPTTEPSYAALILGMTGLGILRARNGLGLPARSRSSDLVLTGILLSLLALRSVYGIVVALLLISAFITQTRRRSGGSLIFWFVFIPLIPLAIGLAPENSRIARVFVLLSQLNFYDLQIVDNSAYMRLGPTIEMFNQITPSQVEFWIGHGAGSAESYFGGLFGHLAGTEFYEINLGFFPAFTFDYGILTSLAILVYLFSIAHGPLSTYVRFFIFIALFNANFNTNLFWFLITVAFLTSPKMIGAHRLRIPQPHSDSTQWPHTGNQL